MAQSSLPLGFFFFIILQIPESEKRFAKISEFFYKAAAPDGS